MRSLEPSRNRDADSSKPADLAAFIVAPTSHWGHDFRHVLIFNRCRRGNGSHTGWAIGLSLAFHCPATCALVRPECRYETQRRAQDKRRASRQGADLRAAPARGVPMKGGQRAWPARKAGGGVIGNVHASSTTALANPSTTRAGRPARVLSSRAKANWQRLEQARRRYRSRRKVKHPTHRSLAAEVIWPLRPHLPS